MSLYVYLSPSRMAGDGAKLFQGSVLSGYQYITAERLVLLPPYSEDAPSTNCLLYKDAALVDSELPVWGKDAKLLSFESFQALGAINPNSGLDALRGHEKGDAEKVGFVQERRSTKGSFILKNKFPSADEPVKPASLAAGDDDSKEEDDV